MFVQNLNREQQSALLYLAKVVAGVDGNNDELQLGMAELLLKQSEDGVTEKAVSTEQLASIFDTERAKCSLLLELIGIAQSNGEYHSSEKNLIAQYADALLISNEKLTALETWVEKQLALLSEVESLLN